MRNPQFTVDEYGDAILIWDFYNGATQKFEKVQVNKFPIATANAGWEWSKSVTISGNVDSIQHAGVSVDVFGNYTLVTDVIESENERYAVVHYLKYDGTVIKETKINDTVNIGIQAKTHTVDSSGDCIVAVDRRQSDQLASYRFNDENDLDFDHTKLNKSTLTLHLSLIHISEPTRPY